MQYAKGTPNKSMQSIADKKAIKKLREQLGLVPIKAGNRKCLCCNKNFASLDLANNKMCADCRTKGD